MIAVRSRLLRASLFVASLMILGLALASCGASGGQTVQTDPQAATSRNIAMELKFPDGYSYSKANGGLGGADAQASRLASYVTRITLTISGNGIAPLTVEVPLDTMAVTVFLGKGTYTFTLTVYTSIGVTFTATSVGEIGSATPPAVSFDLDVNSPPTLDSLTGGGVISTSQRATLIASASDLDDDDILTYKWTSNGGSISGSGNTATFSSGTPGTYTVSVLVSDGHGGTATGNAQVRVLEVATGAVAPTGVLASGATGQAKVSWSAVTGATSYNIYWKTSAGVTKANGTKITGATSPYVHTGLTGGVTYYYVVTAVNAVGESVESAEVNAMPVATYTVTKTADTNDGVCNADCSLREAISAANAGPGGETISIPAGTYAITIAGVNENLNATGDFDIRKSVTITGAGAGSTTINGGGLDGVFHITGAFTVIISAVTITGGDTTTGGNTANGGGINNGGTLTITNSTISGNKANFGGGINVSGGTLAVTACTISGNTATWGGGIGNGATLAVTNSTISGNTATTNSGGGINNGGTLTVTNSTISGNTASATAGVSGGIHSSGGSATISNSIVASQTAGADCSVATGTITSNGRNLESAVSCGFAGVGDLQNTNPLLGALANNGGPTQTMALSAGSPAIDAGSCVNATDQRGTARPQGAGCDIGAYEK